MSVILLIAWLWGSHQGNTVVTREVPTHDGGSTVTIHEGDDYTTTCSHVKCKFSHVDNHEGEMSVHVHYHHAESYGHRHVCKDGLHTHGKCGCECFDEMGNSIHNSLLATDNFFHSWWWLVLPKCGEQQSQVSYHWYRRVWAWVPPITQNVGALLVLYNVSMYPCTRIYDIDIG